MKESIMRQKFGEHIVMQKKGAAVVIHRTVRDDKGKIVDIKFQFVDRDIFNDSYEKYVSE